MLVRPLGLVCLTAVCAAAALAVLVSFASARNLSITSQTIKDTWSRLDFSGGFGTVECAMTVEGSLHATTLAKVAEALVGYVTSAISSSPCNRGGMTILRETLPWHITYVQFFGTLPNVDGISYGYITLSARFREPTFGIECLARSTREAPSIARFNREAGGRITGVTMSGTIPCGSVSGTISGTGRVTNASGQSVTVTLI